MAPWRGMSSTAFFPLRCSVEWFSDPSSPAAVTKAKEAAVLFEHLVFEVGLLDVTITPSASMALWTPPDDLTSERLADTRRPITLGSDVIFAVGEEEVPGQPAAEMRAVVSDRLSARYLAEFHTGILDDLATHKPDWVTAVAVGGQGLPTSTPAGRAVADLNGLDRRTKGLMADHDNFLRTFLYKSFNHDLVVAADLDATFSVTSLFAPMLEQRGLASRHVGDQALSIVVPNIGSLPWEAVGEFRDHPGSQEARAMLVEFETRAAEQEPDDAYAWLRSVSQQVTAAYAGALADSAKSLPEELAKDALLTGVAFIPAVGPLAAQAGTLTQTLREAMRDRRSWSAALWQLRGH
jgi:hypothetical protein